MRCHLNPAIAVWLQSHPLAGRVVELFYDVAEPEVHLLAVVAKHLTYEWLEQHGTPL